MLFEKQSPKVLRANTYLHDSAYRIYLIMYDPDNLGCVSLCLRLFVFALVGDRDWTLEWVISGVDGYLETSGLAFFCFETSLTFFLSSQYIALLFPPLVGWGTAFLLVP